MSVGFIGVHIMRKIISINKEEEGFQVFYEEAECNIFPKTIYVYYEKFCNILCKFDPYARFLIEPVEIKEITYEGVKILYNELASKFRCKGKKKMKMNSDFITIEYLQFLDALRLSGKTNMFYSVQNLRQKFPDLTEDMGRNILVHWFQTFRQRAKEKVQRGRAQWLRNYVSHH
jgi:hypothetical protein